MAQHTKSIHSDTNQSSDSCSNSWLLHDDDDDGDKHSGWFSLEPIYYDQFLYDFFFGSCFFPDKSPSTLGRPMYVWMFMAKIVFSAYCITRLSKPIPTQQQNLFIFLYIDVSINFFHSILLILLIWLSAHSGGRKKHTNPIESKSKLNQ